MESNKQMEATFCHRQEDRRRLNEEHRVNFIREKVQLMAWQGLRLRKAVRMQRQILK